MALDELDILDIRTKQPVANHKLIHEVVNGLSSRNEDGYKSMPTVILYDEVGLDLFDKITYLEEYYLTLAEIDILEKHGEEIANLIPENATIIELGCGSLRKTPLLLDKLEARNTSFQYFALDVSNEALALSIKALNEKRNYKNIKISGLLGDYDDGLLFGASLPSTSPIVYLWIGSSIGNFKRKDASEFMLKFQKGAMKTGDIFILGMDKRNDPSAILAAYNDSEGITDKFIMNGLVSFNKMMGTQVFDRNQFQYYSRYNSTEGRHEAYYRSLQDQVIEIPFEGKIHRILIKEDELINIEYSHKYNQEDREGVEAEAHLLRIASWEDSSSRFTLHAFEKPPFYFPLKKDEEKFPVIPTIEEFREQWKAWDFITTTLVKKDRVLMKPVSLRHPFLFYIGHVPVFLDNIISKCLKISNTEPIYFSTLFERGMDPDMDDTSRCHPCSKVPNKDSDWPLLEDILKYQLRVRERLERIYATRTSISGDLARVLFYAFEHESYHIDTFLGLVLQAPEHFNTNSVRLPVALNPIRFASSEELPRIAPASWCEIHGQEITMGHNDHTEQEISTEYGWDNENPECKTKVDGFLVQSRPVSVGEYYYYLKDTDQLANLPASWRICKSSITGLGVLCIAGIMELEKVWTWPVSTSVAEAKRYSQHFGYRIGTEAELRLTMELSQEKPHTLNVGFRTWCPTSMNVSYGESNRDELIAMNNYKTNQGGWEITSSVFKPFPGFEASKFYPGFSADFYDGKHFVFLGGSWSLHPRLAQRKSVRNWFQERYPYQFSQFRCVRPLN